MISVTPVLLRPAFHPGFHDCPKDKPTVSATPLSAEVEIGADQPEYEPMKCIIGSSEYRVVTVRFKLTWRERWDLLCGGNLWLQQLTFNKPFAPVKLSTTEPEIEDCL
jgi:hypothetical protein